MSRWRRTAALLSVLALVVAACGGDDEPDDAPDDDGAAEEPADDGDDADEGDDEGEAEGPTEIATDIGVTDEPCPNAVNADNGCIYLGVLSDLTEGPFAALGVEIVAGQRAFWQTVNEAGGIGGYDVDIDEYTRDTLYNPQEHASQYRSIEPNILALAQTLGTPPTEAILPDMDIDDVVGVPAGWWSGQQFQEQDQGLILESGYSYCLESMIGLDFINAEVGEIESLLAVGYPGDYGGDFAFGAEAWAEANDVEFLGFAETGPNAVVGSQDAAVQQVLNAGASAVAIATGPAEVAEIIGGSLAQGYEGVFLGSVPTWNPALMDSPAAPALEAAYFHIGPWEAFDGDSDAHVAMQEALGGEFPTNDGYTFGWIWSYPLLTALEDAAANGDLTRAGVREAASQMTVSYEGALPDRDFSLDGTEGAPRVAVISRPDTDAELNLSTLATNVTGPTADAFAYDSPCVVP
ncbi:MAG: ABC transporter substrate-binding protein [Nitriliruptoraceae bacterium]|nr:ABC transporter substrate-binding protein [Nitriliruptoraceae bacterium]